MTGEIMQWLRGVKDRWHIRPRRILEVGALNVNGSPRSVFHDEDQEYIGIDLDHGPGVTVKGDAVAILKYWWADPNGQNLFDLAITTETLEHARDPAEIVRMMRQFLHKDGFLIITSPAQSFPEHNYPSDYWRFMPAAYIDVFLSGMLILDHHLTSDPCHCWLARKTDR